MLPCVKILQLKTVALKRHYTSFIFKNTITSQNEKKIWEISYLYLGNNQEISLPWFKDSKKEWWENMRSEEIARLRWKMAFLHVYYLIYIHYVWKSWSLSHVWLCNPMDCSLLLSMEFFRQEYWSGLPFPSLGIFPTWGLNLDLLHCSRFFTVWATRDAWSKYEFASRHLDARNVTVLKLALNTPSPREWDVQYQILLG